MNYLGIDIGKKFHVAGIVGDDGHQIGMTLEFRSNWRGWEKLQQFLSSRGSDPSTVKVGLEATGHYWLPLYEKMKESGFDLTVFNPVQIASFRNKDIRGQKTDNIDAILIAQVLRFGEGSKTKLPDNQTLTLRKLSRFRCDLVDQISSIKKKILAILDQTFPEYTECFENAFGKGSLALLSRYPTPEEIVQLDLEKLTKLLAKASRNHFGEDKARKVKEKAKKTFGVKFGLDAFQLQIKLMTEQIKYLEKQIKKIEKEIKVILGDHVLLSISGISYRTAGLILGEIGNFQRFVEMGNDRKAVKSLTALGGLDARLRESGRYRGQVRMSKRGSKYLRRALMQSSFIAAQHDPRFKAVYEKQKKKGKHHFVALTHVARKMISVVYAVLRDQKPYQRDVVK